MTVYKITANGEDVEIVEEQRNGDRYLVAKDVPIVKPMELDTGYVPEASIAQSTSLENTHGTTGWSGTTPTVNHPRNDPAYSWHDPSRPNDELVLAANEEVQETLGVGAVESDRWDGEFVRADIAVNADRAEEMGGEAAEIVDALESGGPLEVSSQYLHAELPAGNYDGEHREDPKAIAAPDSVALIPNGKGVCSIEDGCGIAPGATANIAAHANMDAIAANGVAAAVADDPTAVVTGEETAAGVGAVLNGLASLLRQAGPGPVANVAETPAVDPRGSPTGNETTSRRRLLQIAKNQEGFPGPFPFDGPGECEARMAGEVDNPDEFCGAWYGQSKNATGNDNESGGNEGAESSVESPDGTPVDGPDASDLDDPGHIPGTDPAQADHEMKTANATFEGESVAEIMGVVGGTIEPQVDELMDEVRENLDDDYDPDDVETIMGAIGGTLEAHVDDAVDDMTDALRREGNSPDNRSSYHTGNMDRDELIDEITANSNIKRGSLEGMGDTCLETTHENIVGNETDETEDEQTDEETADDGGTTDDSDGGTLADMTVEDLADGLREQGFVTEDSIDQHVETAANQLEAEERAERIVANSAEYGEDDVEWIAELPEKELERKEQGVSLTGGLPAAGSPGFGAAGNEDETDTGDMPDLEVS